MLRSILIITMLALSFNTAFCVDIPDELYPIDNNAEILYTYEFDDQPKFIDRVNKNEFVALVLDGDEAILYNYKIDENAVNEKVEFEINDEEQLAFHRVVDKKLILLFLGYNKSLMGASNPMELYLRKTEIDLSTYKPVNSKIIYSTMTKDELDIDEYNDDLDYASDEISNSIFITQDIVTDAPFLYVLGAAYDENDNTGETAIPFLLKDEENQKLHLVVTFLDSEYNVKNNYAFNLQEDIEDFSNINVNYSYLNDESNVYFIYSWANEDTEKRYMSVNEITSDGKFNEVRKEIQYSIDGDESYKVGNFKKIKYNNNKLNLFGISRFEEAMMGEIQPISALYSINVSTDKLSLDIKEKPMTIEEGEEINDGEEFKFNNISKVIEHKNNYVILAENTAFVMSEGYDSGSNMARPDYNFTFKTINLFSVDKELNINWNSLIEDRGFLEKILIYGRSLSSTQRTPGQVFSKPEINNNEIEFLYTSNEPEEHVKHVKYNMDDGSLIESKPLFENDGLPSFFPGLQFEVSDNEYVTLLNIDEYYLVRYKINE